MRVAQLHYYACDIVFFNGCFCNCGSQRHFSCRMCVSEEYSTDLVQFQACEFSGIGRQKSCVGSGFRFSFLNKASDFSNLSHTI